MVYCIVLYCIVLYCIVLYCIVLYCIDIILYYLIGFDFIMNLNSNNVLLKELLGDHISKYHINTNEEVVNEIDKNKANIISNTTTNKISNINNTSNIINNTNNSNNIINNTINIINPNNSTITTSSNLKDKATKNLINQLYEEDLLQEYYEYNNTSNNITSITNTNTNNHNPTTTLSEEDLSYTPIDVFSFFQLYNTLYFSDQLFFVSLEWSKRMKLCAGLFEVNNQLMKIKLSQPLLQFRSNKEIKETLLHEMIHAFLHINKKEDSRDGHGNFFKEKMNEINKKTGLNITVYHSFHDEVDYFKTHIWRCNGKCKYEYPYYGYVKRSMNRAPGKNDRWFEEHSKKCGGKFEKMNNVKIQKNKNNNEKRGVKDKYSKKDKK